MVIAHENPSNRVVGALPFEKIFAIRPERSMEMSPCQDHKDGQDGGRTCRVVLTNAHSAFQFNAYQRNADQRRADIINMSYGEPTTTPNAGRFIDLATEASRVWRAFAWK